MAYQNMAGVYDQLMDNVPYDDWIILIQQMIEEASVPVQSIIDLGCGTGVITRKLAAQGYEMTGVDQSGEMLIEARKGTTDLARIHWKQADMVSLESDHLFYDMAISCCDVMNYITDWKDVEKTFRNVYDLLKQGGVFFFDVHSLFTVEEKYIGHSFTDQTEDAAYIWECVPGDEIGEMFHQLTFFQKEKGDCFTRFQEKHHQRTFAVDEYKNCLKKIGFKKIVIYADFSLKKNEWTDTSERIFFLAEK